MILNIRTLYILLYINLHFISLNIKVKILYKTNPHMFFNIGLLNISRFTCWYFSGTSSSLFCTVVVF